MILTVTPNTGLDRVLFVSTFHRNRRNQVEDWVEAMGGKGCDVSLILRELGVETVATGLAGGETGRRMEGMLRRAGVTPDFVWTEGETRTNTVLIETDTGAHTTLCAAGLRPDEHALPALLDWIGKWAKSAEAVVVAGSVPEAWDASVYGELVRAAAQHGAPVVVDASGPQLGAGVAAGAAAAKPNHHELEALCGPLEGEPALLEAAMRLRESGPRWVLVSRGAEGSLLVSEEGAWRAEPVPVQAVNPAGAGDGMTACLALGLANGWDEPETLRWAAAVSTAIVLTRGTAEVRHARVEELLPRVRIRQVGG